MMWLVPLTVFPLVAALFLGGSGIVTERGSPLRELLGLLITFAIYTGIWALLRMAAMPLFPPGIAMALATVISIPAFLIAAFVGFMVVGVKLRRV